MSPLSAFALAFLGAFVGSFIGVAIVHLFVAVFG